MTSPRFSVVVPTRDRASTLAYTLRTCLEQEFDDYEVVETHRDLAGHERVTVGAQRR